MTTALKRLLKMNNTVKRSLSGVLFLGVVLAGLLINKYLFALLFIFMEVCMLAEFYKMTMGDRYPKSRLFAIFIAVLTFCIIFSIYSFHIPIKFTAVIALALVGLMSSSLFVNDKEDFHLFSNLYTGLFYIAIPLGLSNLIVFDAQGNFSGILMVCFFCIIWASDVGAYCFGLLFGKNGKKLCPSISPKKSWAGFWGGLLSAILVSVILKLTGLFPHPMVHCLILAIIMDVAGVFGDLFESQWKRISGIKDSGSIIPGHGGMLDRFDSTIFAIPAGTAYLAILGLL